MERALVALPDFKSGVTSEQGVRWVRFPCTSANGIFSTFWFRISLSNPVRQFKIFFKFIGSSFQHKSITGTNGTASPFRVCLPSTEPRTDPVSGNNQGQIAPQSLGNSVRNFDQNESIFFFDLFLLTFHVFAYIFPLRKTGNIFIFPKSRFFLPFLLAAADGKSSTPFSDRFG